MGVAAAAAALGTWAAIRLWHTSVPPLHLPQLDAETVFGDGLVERARRYERLLRILFVLLLLAHLVAVGLVVRHAPRLRLGLGRVGTGLVLATVAATAAWAAALPLHGIALWWRRRHGISEQTWAAFAAGQLASLARLALAVAVAVAIALALAGVLGRGWWIAAAPLAAAATLVAVVVTAALTSGPAPRPLVAQERALAARERVDPPRLVVTPPPGRLRVANAEAVGVGPARRVVLWRTILRRPFDSAERRFVIAHELAHHGRRHVWKAIAWVGLLALPLLALVDLVVPGLRRPDAVPRALLVALVLWVALLPLESAISRRYETEADWQALRATSDPAAARALFVDFARTALQEPDPPRWETVLLGDHPTLLERVELAEAWRRRLTRPGSRAGS